MTPDRIDRTLSPRDYAALTDAAKRRAEELRRAAASDFWRAVGRAVRSALSPLRSIHSANPTQVQPCRP